MLNETKEKLPKEARVPAKQQQPKRKMLLLPAKWPDTQRSDKRTFAISYLAALFIFPYLKASHLCVGFPFFNVILLFGDVR